ncbi:hypothetical protein E2C01_042799 [Portunus trituberculatus]|uniref:Uncharacterized protein n=1 Tax=Portunus trituberculatus TaxID=210409 RepID=A0A5B7FNI1_PORTR|nr:hypothetical protein [Portunus trituberculatus]
MRRRKDSGAVVCATRNSNYRNTISSQHRGLGTTTTTTTMNMNNTGSVILWNTLLYHSGILCTVNKTKGRIELRARFVN